MDRYFLTGQLIDNAARIKALCGGVSTDNARWRPGTENWSMLEVINHLYDEEREDFRVRLNLIFTDPRRYLTSTINGLASLPNKDRPYSMQ